MLSTLELILGVVLSAFAIATIMVAMSKKFMLDVYTKCPIGKEVGTKLDKMCSGFKEMNARGKTKAILDTSRDNILDVLTDAMMIQLRHMDGESVNGEVKATIKALQQRKSERDEIWNQIIATQFYTNNK